jgi:hypothetical protein
MDLITVHGRHPQDCTEDNCLRSGWTLREFVAQCVLWALASLIYTYACSKVLPTRDFNGSPLYNWLSCLPVQLVAFPAVAAWCVAAYDGGFIEWLSAPWSQLAATPERVFLLLIYAYMFKDLGLYLLNARMDAMYWAHHLGCWVIILQFFFTTAPGIFIFGGGVAMEFGGAAQTIHLLYPDDATLDLMHVATMTLSHVPCGVREPSRRRAAAVLGATSRRWRGNSTPSSRRSSGGDVASMAWKLHAIEQTRFWGRRRVDGEGCPHRSSAAPQRSTTRRSRRRRSGRA